VCDPYLSALSVLQQRHYIKPFTFTFLPLLLSWVSAGYCRCQRTRLLLSWHAQWPAFFSRSCPTWVRRSVWPTWPRLWSTPPTPASCLSILRCWMTAGLCRRWSQALAAEEDLGQRTHRRSKSFCEDSYSTWSAAVSTAVLIELDVVIIINRVTTCLEL